MIEIFNKSKKPKEAQEEEVFSGQVYVIPQSDKKISVETSKVTNLLQKLETTSDKFDAIDAIVEQTPDGKMAYNTYLRLANQGIKIELFNAKNGRPLKKYDTELRAFCANMGGNTSNGLDGLIDQLHGSAITHGGMACEVVVAPGAKEIEGVIVIDPKTITEFEWLEDKKRYAAYQQGTSGKKVDLYDGNFFWIPHQPKAGNPIGTLQFEPAIETMTQYYRFMRDRETILNRIGYPKYDISIDMEKFLASLPQQTKSDPEKLQKAITDNFEKISNGVSNISPGSSFIHYDSFSVNVVGGGVNGSGVDVRAWDSIFDALIPNAFQLTPVMLGRLKSGSYSLGTVEFKVVKDNVEVTRRASKRMIEKIINIWARVMGYNVYAVVTHNPVDWQTEEEKYKAQLLRLERARRVEEYGYAPKETTAIMAIGDDADPQEGKGDDRYEYLKSAGASASQSDANAKEDNAGGGDNKDEEGS